MSVLTQNRLLSPEVLSSHQINVLVVTWQHPFTRQISAIGLLTRDLSGTYGFDYVQNVTNVTDFVPLVGFPDLHKHYESNRLFPIFEQRVMDPRRPDYRRFISSIGLSESSTPWEQLSHSGGRRGGDTLQLLPVPTPVEGTRCTWEVEFLVHGMRHIAGKTRSLSNRDVVISRRDQEDALANLRAGDRLLLCPEPTNRINSKAIVVTTVSGIPLGYLPDVFTEDFAELELDNLRCFAEVVNDVKAPWHLRLTAKLVCTVPENFRFFASASWRPLCSN